MIATRIQISPIVVLMLTQSLFVAISADASGQQELDGDWITDRGAMTIKIDGDNLSGTFAGGGEISGTRQGELWKVQCSRKEDKWSAEMDLDETWTSFKGKTTEANGEGNWRGWKRDKDVSQGANADVSGYWLTNWGNMHLEQNDDKVSGFFSSARWGSVEGAIQGRKLTLQWGRFNFKGKAELEVSADGKRLIGMDTGENASPWFGIRPTGFEKGVAPKAGEIVQGIADNGMLYFLRMPDGWKQGDKVDVVILLHGSNWTTAGMVHITNKNWPEIGKKFAIMGIQGESWAKWSDLDDLRFNYTYVNWVGRSTLGGFPGTDRESPFLVAELLDELGKQYSFRRVFLGGHSQGGYLTYMMHMHFPEKLAGTFPIAGGMIIQAEPNVFDDEALIAQQRNLPMAIIHGKQDKVVPFSMGQYAYDNYLSYGFGKVRLISPSTGHPFDFLPVDEAIAYLDALTTEDPKQLLEFARAQVTKKNWRDVGNAVARAKEIDGGKEFSEIWKKLQEAAKQDAASLLRDIEKNSNNKWVDRYHQYEFQFRNATAAQPVIEAFEKLREEHAESAKELMKQAREAFRSGDRNKGMGLYQEIVDKQYAAVEYATAKRALKPPK